MQNNDILKELEINQDIENKQNIENDQDIYFKEIIEQFDSNDIEIEVKKNKTKFPKLIFLIKYIATSSLIFCFLLVTTNYSAYYQIFNNYFNEEKLQVESKGIISSVQASNIKEKYIKNINEEKKIIEDEKNEQTTDYSIRKLINISNKNDINLNIEITPYENRIVIPKIGKNIPLLDIENKEIDGGNELNNIFMKELENGVIRYPGSSKPGDDGTTFIFGHSSNFPWIKGDYNEVFALLDNIEYEDEIIIYYNQKKYIYKIREKKVITPGDVSVLERNKKKSELTLMTCWPIGTTLNRLIVVGEIVEG